MGTQNFPYSRSCSSPILLLAGRLHDRHFDRAFAAWRGAQSIVRVTKYEWRATGRKSLEHRP
eukprot:1071830-Pyramimonas_sp.AAC.1